MLDLSSGKGMLVGFCSAAVDNWSHLALPALKISVHKALENSWLGRNIDTKPISSKIVLSQLDPFCIKINLIHRINLSWLKNQEFESSIKNMQYFEGTNSLCLQGDWRGVSSFCMRGYFYILSSCLFKSICQKLNTSFKNLSPSEKTSRTVFCLTLQIWL